jgi:hypothetical protein
MTLVTYWIMRETARPRENAGVIFRTVFGDEHCGMYHEHADGYNWVAISSENDADTYTYFTDEQVKDWRPDL